MHVQTAKRSLVVLLVLLLVSGCGGYGTKLKFKGGELYYTKSASKDDAQKLGDYLLKDGFFTDEPRTVQLNQSGDTYEVRMVIKPEFRDNADYLRIMGVFGAEIAQNVFDGKPLVMHLCDEHLKTVKEVKPFASLTRNQGTLYYDSSIVKAEAEKLLLVLSQEGFFDGNRKTVFLSSPGAGYSLWVVVRPGAHADPTIEREFKQLCKRFSQKAFGGKPVTIYLSDEQLKTLKAVTAE